MLCPEGGLSCAVSRWWPLLCCVQTVASLVLYPDGGLSCAVSRQWPLLCCVQTVASNLLAGHKDGVVIGCLGSSMDFGCRQMSVILTRFVKGLYSLSNYKVIFSIL